MKKETKATQIMKEIRSTREFEEMSPVSTLYFGYTAAMLAKIADTEMLVIVKEEIGGGKVEIKFIVDKENVDMSISFDGDTLKKNVDTLRENSILRYHIEDIINTIRENRKSKDSKTAKHINPTHFAGVGMVQMCL